MERPSGVTIIAVLAILGGIIGILNGLSGLGYLGPVDAPLSWTVLSGIILFLAILKIAIGIGLWRLDSWAWIWAVIVVGLHTVADVFSLTGGISIFVLLSLLVNAIILFYLFRPNVKTAFGR